MKEIVHLDWTDVHNRAGLLVRQIYDRHHGRLHDKIVMLHPVPRGGVFAVLLLKAQLARVYPKLCVDIVDDPAEADYYVDDIIDTGNTRLGIQRLYGDKPFLALVDHQDELEPTRGKWVVFPWEKAANELGPEENIVRVLEYIGEDPKRPGLLETPARVVRSYKELFAGYGQQPADVFKIFDEPNSDEMVLVKGIEFMSMCEHHMLPFVGKAHVAYIPQGDRIIGVSKLGRLVDVFARRLQVQERLTRQITSALDEHLQPCGSACVIEAKHFCMMCRGVQKQQSSMVTSSLTGVFRESSVRAEFMNLIRG